MNICEQPHQPVIFVVVVVVVNYIQCVPSMMP